MSKSSLRKIVLSGVFALSALGVWAQGAEWKAKKAPMMTRWAKDVSPEKVLAEYPRPQMVRGEWKNLNGLWEYAEGKEGEKPATGRALAGKILVPFPVESALSGVMKQMERVTYRRTFEMPAKWREPGQRVLLHFGAVDWESTVYVNGKQMGVHRGGYDPFTYDITDALKKDGEQEVVVSVWDPSDEGDQPRGKQVKNPKGIWYTPTTGIWQTVWLEPVPAGHVRDLKIVPDVDKGEVAVTIDTGSPAAGSGQMLVTVTDPDDGKIVAEGGGLDVKLKIPNAKLWSPETPHLYDVTVKVGNDEVKGYFGMRKIEVAKDEKGVNRLMLNGKPLFEVGMLDQGFWPDGLYTAPTDEASKFDIEQQKKLGFNLIRKHVKVEPARWYYWADKLGMLVWQDMPSANNKTEESKKQYEAELTQLIKTHWNHPSIIMWVVFNEGWGQYDTPRVTKLAKDLDPTRLVNNASGWTDAGAGDVIDMHSYPGPSCPKTEEKRAAVLGEFGGLGLVIPGHQWWDKTFSYSGMDSPEEFVRQYTRLLGRAYQLKENAGLSAIVYTQTTDVEGEINGLMTYDREMKGDLEKLKTANAGLGPIVEQVTVVGSAHDAKPAEWHYTTEKQQGNAWAKPGFDDKGWKVGAAGFGSDDVAKDGESLVKTKWEGADIYLRRDVEIPADAITKDLRLWASHDDGMVIFINGHMARTRRNATSVYEEQPINKEAFESLKPGKNVIAVHANNTGGPGYIDVGLVKVIEKPNPAAAQKGSK